MTAIDQPLDTVTSPGLARFGEAKFRSILDDVLDAGYRFARFDDIGSDRDGPVFHLRHDVDISPAMALCLGRIEHEYGVAANFFFQMNAETYSFFVPETLGTIRTLQAMGHCVGLHVDEAMLGSDERSIERTLDWLRDHIVAVDWAISFHRPAPHLLGRRYERFISAYDDRLFDASSYLSDSRRSLAFCEPLALWLAARRPHVQLLLHPEWWSEIDSIELFWTQLRDRRTDQLRRYLRYNFAKVFKDVLTHEDRHLGI